MQLTQDLHLPKTMDSPNGVIMHRVCNMSIAFCSIRIPFFPILLKCYVVDSASRKC
jgi:hypothetical protein